KSLLKGCSSGCAACRCEERCARRGRNMRRSKRSALVAIAAAAGALAVVSPVVLARPPSDSTWKGPGTVAAPTGGSWSVGTNWSPSGVPGNDLLTKLTFGGSGLTAYTSTNDIGNASSQQKVGT